MKRTVGILAGLASVGVGVYLGAQLCAQQPAAAPAARPLRTRIAVVNMAVVIKQYSKAQTFQQQFIEQIKQYNTQYLEPLRTQIAKDQKDYQDPNTPAAKREQLERELRQLQLQYRDKEEDVKKQLEGKESEGTVQLYREIEDMVRQFAVSYDYELVMFFTDPVNPTSPYDPKTIQNRLSMRACVPMYMAPGMDISESVAAALNQKVKGTAAAAPATTGAVASQPATTGTAPRQ